MASSYFGIRSYVHRDISVLVYIYVYVLYIYVYICIHATTYKASKLAIWEVYPFTEGIRSVTAGIHTVAKERARATHPFPLLRPARLALLRRVWVGVF